MGSVRITHTHTQYIAGELTCRFRCRTDRSSAPIRHSSDLAGSLQRQIGRAEQAIALRHFAGLWATIACATIELYKPNYCCPNTTTKLLCANKWFSALVHLNHTVMAYARAVYANGPARRTGSELVPRCYLARWRTRPSISLALVLLSVDSITTPAI